MFLVQNFCHLCLGQAFDMDGLALRHEAPRSVLRSQLGRDLFAKVTISRLTP
jgi:hypothetical protein